MGILEYELRMAGLQAEIAILRRHKMNHHYNTEDREEVARLLNEKLNARDALVNSNVPF